ncbi:hypothetical protein Taro_051330 [Colocasia esculenta]|uniref:Disease resistance RPP13-like protein 4 n=1 Tax=Colocasia esculenta TaxID=4460 RepID=A0A843XGI2_COLES|nr:hypothetical protein [Colocasia esculenta]
MEPPMVLQGLFHEALSHHWRSFAGEGIVEEVVSPLLKQLANARLLADRSFIGDGNLSEIGQLLEKVERTVGDMKAVFLRAGRWETDVVDELGSVARHVEEILEDGDGSDEFQRKLQRIEQSVSRIKEQHVTPPLQLPLLEDSSNSRSPPTRRPVRFSEDGAWWQLELERRILESSAMAELQVSYDALDRQLKLCLLCFSIFPEGSVIKKRALVYWWMGEGLVGNTAEETGERCFGELVARGLLEPIRRKHSPLQASRFRMHPWVRRMLISVARRGEFFDFDGDGNPRADSTRSRRACLVNSAKQGPLAEELSTLFNVDEPYLRFRKGWLANLRKVAVLQLGRWQGTAKHHIEVEETEFLEGLGGLKHLRYLGLQGISRIRELPASIAELSNLRILDLRACHNLERLPPGIASLRELTHMDVSDCHLLEQMPRGLGALQELQVLKGFVVGNSRSRDPCRLSELAKLGRLRKLSICIGGEAVATEAEMDMLKGLGSLRSLAITWGVVSSPIRKGAARLKRAATMSMTSLGLPRGLEKLDLRCFPRPEPPEWLNPAVLMSLRKLYVRGGKLRSLGLSTLRPWRTVEVVRLRFLSELQIEWSLVQAAFPKLACMEIHKCEKMDSSRCSEDGVWVKMEDP